MLGVAAPMFLAASLLSACGPASGVNDDEPVKLGLVYGMSGACASAGERQEKGARLAVDQVNEQGGIDGRTVELTVKDTACDPTQTIRQIRDLAQKDVHLLFGLGVSNEALAAKPILNQVESTLMVTAAHTSQLFDDNPTDFMFRISDDARTRNVAAARLMHEKFPDAHKWASVSPDYGYGHETWEFFRGEMERLDPDFEVVEEAWTPLDTTDYRPYIQSVMGAEPDGVFSSLYTSLAVTFYQQAKPFNFFKDLDAFLIVSDELEVAKAMGEGMEDEWAGSHYYPGSFDNELNDRFVETYKAKYGEEPTGYSSESYSAVWAYKAAIEKADSSSAKDVSEALKGLEVDTVKGVRTFQENGQALTAVAFFRIAPDDAPPGWKVAEALAVPATDLGQ
ncbi:ABC transporter substrate-binding protein [Georgenia ruanii]|uniref:ABC transporter substrate-binding protein n=1 Tax=Georgenia ruanii TaxID=348442 RepID=A0A7J9USZ8_9MICO|nr:ABC transporter substrate-binding protein [Georgenia ruanii]MPV87632.1 ABC transporter substrate-binding protein [Georgenia ruanii]